MILYSSPPVFSSFQKFGNAKCALHTNGRVGSCNCTLSPAAQRRPFLFNYPWSCKGMSCSRAGRARPSSSSVGAAQKVPGAGSWGRCGGLIPGGCTGGIPHGDRTLSVLGVSLATHTGSSAGTRTHSLGGDGTTGPPPRAPSSVGVPQPLLLRAPPGSG